MPEPELDLARLLAETRGGDRAALDALVHVLHAELREIASRQMRRERPEHTLQPTALVNEVYVRLARQKVPDFEGRAHFLGVAAHVMRQVLVDSARAHRSAKRGEGRRVTLEEVHGGAVGPARTVDVLDLDDALVRLAELDPRKARVVELRYFGGLSREEVAEALGVSLATAKRDLTVAEAWLRRELGP